MQPSRKQNPLHRYFKDLTCSSCRPLGHAEEFELHQRIKSGDTKARDRLIQANLRFVVSVAREYRYQGVPLEDLIQAGNKGLVKALQGFDPNKKFKFVSYAVWWIRQEILIAISAQSRNFTLNCTQTARFRLLDKAIERFEQKFHRQPSISELCTLTQLPETAVRQSLDAFTVWVPLDATLKEPLPAKTDPFYEPNRGLHRVIQELPPRQNSIIYQYYGFTDDFCYTSDEIGVRMGISRERVRQIREDALNKLRTCFQDTKWRKDEN